MFLLLLRNEEHNNLIKQMGNLRGANKMCNDKEDTFLEADRYKVYLNNLQVQMATQLAIKTYEGGNTKAYRESKEKYEKAYRKWEKMFDSACNETKLNRREIRTKPQRNLDLYREIQQKARKKKNK